MTDHEHATTLRLIYQDRTRVPDPPALHHRVLAVPSVHQTKPAQWPQFPVGGLHSMFNATKFVVAGVLVALFGGFLLAGVLTTQQDDEPVPAVAASAEAEPTDEATTAPESAVTSNILPGVDLVTEEVEPGVFRIDSDGIRDLDVWDGDHEDTYVGIATGRDGSVWVFWLDSFFRIGGDATHAWLGGPFSLLNRPDIEIGLDGTVWWVGSHGEPGFRSFAGLRSFDGETWSQRMETPMWGAIRDVEIDDAGRVWAAWQDDAAREISVSRLEDDTWTTLRTWNQQTGEFRGPLMGVGSAGDAWMMIEHPEGGELWRLPGVSDGEWESVDAPSFDFWRPHVAPDGTAWIRRFPEGLARYDGAAWTLHPPDASRLVLAPRTYDDAGRVVMEVGTDGSAWFGSQTNCVGVTNFDGTTATTFLPGLCVADMDVAPDGSLWLHSGRPGDSGRFYVITPEALMATR